MKLNVKGKGKAAGLPSTFTCRLTGRVFAAIVSKTYFVDLSAYPRWLVVLVGTLLLALAIWIGMKVLKVALWVFFFIVLIGGFGWAVWEMVR